MSLQNLKIEPKVAVRLGCVSVWRWAFSVSAMLGKYTLSTHPHACFINITTISCSR